MYAPRIYAQIIGVVLILVGVLGCGLMGSGIAQVAAQAGCQPCLDLGDSWVHLRMCMTDGQVLCCDSSKNKHASRHAHQHAPTHQIVRSVQPGEDWLWCYTDQTLVQAPTGGPAS